MPLASCGPSPRARNEKHHPLCWLPAPCAIPPRYQTTWLSDYKRSFLQIGRRCKRTKAPSGWLGRLPVASDVIKEFTESNRWYYSTELVGEWPWDQHLGSPSLLHHDACSHLLLVLVRITRSAFSQREEHLPARMAVTKETVALLDF